MQLLFDALSDMDRSAVSTPEGSFNRAVRHEPPADWTKGPDPVLLCAQVITKNHLDPSLSEGVSAARGSSSV